ncbi:hypothetical protein IF1G_01917 [Cordyceps javanica]|uniref:Uncharacterized protein n=1 Tax=Cordyceps javanica TaxID=43265 RepID=A0A545VD99_9HYPO|nr:hypothetical protein IF1G_01917 [Cordyceps javanica]
MTRSVNNIERVCSIFNSHGSHRKREINQCEYKIETSHHRKECRKWEQDYYLPSVTKQLAMDYADGIKIPPGEQCSRIVLKSGDEVSSRDPTTPIPQGLYALLF